MVKPPPAYGRSKDDLCKAFMTFINRGDLDGAIGPGVALVDKFGSANCDAKLVATLANLLRLDLGVDEALAADITANLATLVSPKQRDVALLESSLQALWNLANTPDGKAAAIAADLCLQRA